MISRSALVAVLLTLLAAMACSGGGGGEAARSSDARAASIALSAGTLAPAFDPATTGYFADVPAASTTALDVMVTTVDAKATVTVNGAPAPAGTARSVAIASGSNVVTVVVTAEDGVATAVYRVEVFGIDVYADAAAADDNGPGDLARPYKTITQALLVAGAGKTVKALPGTYDAASSERFPLRLAAGQVLVGDPGSRGTGPVATRVSGYGSFADAGGFPGDVALVGAAGSRVSGLAFTSQGSPTGTFLVYAGPGAQTVSRNAFDPDASATYGGVFLAGPALVEDNVFGTSSYGAFARGTIPGKVIRGNRFLSMASPVDLEAGDGVLVESNAITGSGPVGVTAQSGAPVIRGNTFDYAPGYTRGAIDTGYSSAVIRANVFRCARGVLVGGGQPDLGTDADPGENDFSAVTGIALVHMGTLPVSVVGNRWPNATPTLSRSGTTDIVVNRTGTATWAAGQSWPDFTPSPFAPDAATLALWHLDDSGQTLTDASGHGRDLVLGATSAQDAVDPYGNETGMFGTSQYYYAWNDAFSSGGGANAFPSNALSVELWYRAGFMQQRQGTIFAAGTNSVAVRWVAGQLTFGVGDGTTLTDLAVTDDAVNGLLANELWHALACTYDGAELRIYLDGTLRASAAHTVGVTAPAGYWIGGLPAAGNSIFGLVDEVRLSDVARSAAEIAAAYEGP